MAEQKPLIVLAGGPQHNQAITELLGDTYRVSRYDDKTGYVSRLIDEHAAMVIVTATEDDAWRFWTTTPKSSPATRRIAMLLISERSADHELALRSGADLVMYPDEIAGQLARTVKDHARVPDPAYVEQLDCDCEGSLPELAQQGVEQFNSGEYYKQHDLFEALWVDTDSSVRDLYRAVLQVGVAYYQIERRNYRGALKMLQRSVQWLTILPDSCQGIDVAQLRRDSYRVRAELERLGESGIDQFDNSLLQPVKMVEKSS